MCRGSLLCRMRGHAPVLSPQLGSSCGMFPGAGFRSYYCIPELGESCKAREHTEFFSPAVCLPYAAELYFP